MEKNYDELEQRKLAALEEAAKAKENASNSTVNFNVDVKGSTCYFNNYSDIHVPECDMNKLRKDLAIDAKIPNMFVGFGGDQTNMALKTSVSDVYNSVTSPEEELDMMVDIIEESGIKDKIQYYIDGNHGLRLTKSTSLRPGKYVTNKLGISDKHVENIARVDFSLNNPLNPDEKVSVIMLSRHGENTASNPGTKVEQTLNSKINRAVDVVIDGHTHKIFFGTTKILIYEPNRKTPIEKTIYTANFGSRLNGSTYADRAGYPLPSKSDGEVLKISLVPNEAKTDFSVCIDFVNRRDLINDVASKKIEEMKKSLSEMEGMEFKTRQQVQSFYRKMSKSMLKNTLKDYKEENDSLLKSNNSANLPKELFFAPLSGFAIGDDTVKNEKEIDKVISVLKKLDNSCKIVLNGDMINYKKANFWAKEKYPDHTFSYIELLAEKLEPVKDKIIAYNSGVQEAKIMKYHGEELAKYAMTRLQLDEKLAYMPYNKTQLIAEQKKIQSKQVEDYNKALLAKEMKKCQNNFEATLENLGPYGLKGNDTSVEKIEQALVLKLREEEKLLSMRKHKDIINVKFPLSDIELRRPHENLVQHMLCELLDIDAKEISMNSKVNTDSYMSVKIKGPKRRHIPVNFIGGYSSSIAARGAQFNRLGKKENQSPGANVYFMNARSGKEYMTKGRTVMANGDGSNSIIDNYYISAGRFDGSADRVEQELSSNRLYKFEWAEVDEETKEKTRSIYQTDANPYTLTCSSVDYESALMNDQVLENVLQKQILDSFNKIYEKVSNQESQIKKAKARQIVENAMKNKPRKSTKNKEKDKEEDDSAENSL